MKIILIAAAILFGITAALLYVFRHPHRHGIHGSDNDVSTQVIVVGEDGQPLKSTNKHGIHGGCIAGIVVGAAAVIGGVVAAVVCCGSSKKGKNANKGNGSKDNKKNDGTIQPPAIENEKKDDEVGPGNKTPPNNPTPTPPNNPTPTPPGPDTTPSPPPVNACSTFNCDTATTFGKLAAANCVEGGGTTCDASVCCDQQKRTCDALYGTGKPKSCPANHSVRKNVECTSPADCDSKCCEVRIELLATDFKKLFKE